MVKVKKNLNFKSLVNGFKEAINIHDDQRRQKSVDYAIKDIGLSVLACMFYKAGSLLHFQKILKQRMYRNNLETQFDVQETPCDNQIRSVIASISTSTYEPIFKDYLNRLQRSKDLQKYRFQKHYLIALDGTQYHCSEEIHCSECLERKKKNGVIEYSHQALQPIICHPDQKQIIPLMPEPIRNIDGTKKQDCEIKAAKRLLPKIRAKHPRMDFIWLADSIYATSTFIKEILEYKEKFIFRIKPGDHKALYEHIETADYVSHSTDLGKTKIAYHWYNEVPLNKSTDIKVTVLKAFVIKIDKSGKKSSTIAGIWATNIDINKYNVAGITKAARARWKVENQCFNALKNSGYELTHNWGHVNGEAFNFYILVMLGFYLHQILELTDRLFQWCRQACGSHKLLWEDLNGLFKFMVFSNWESMLLRCLEANGVDPPEMV